ncbi:MAG: putative metal-binding motif-containing protein [Deltaproteobacteria bacterium]|nr:putative metal-binding motif-containing protein [Deltaproteobacteria bacterium]
MKHFVLVEVQGGLLDATVYDVDGGVLDTWQVGTYDGDEVDDDGDGYTEQEGDCDDANDAVNPDAVDECDGVDNDCDGADEGCPEDTDADTDTDGTVTGKGCGCGVGGSASAGLLLFPVLALLRRRRSSSTPG